MSGFSKSQPTGRTPGNLAQCQFGNFLSGKKLAEYQRIIDNRGNEPRDAFKVKKVKVRVFDLSDQKQVKEYERLWAALLERQSRMEVIIEASRDLVKRPDGTSYWMKYVEYVELDEGRRDEKWKNQ